MKTFFGIIFRSFQVPGGAFEYSIIFRNKDDAIKLIDKYIYDNNLSEDEVNVDNKRYLHKVFIYDKGILIEEIEVILKHLI